MNPYIDVQIINIKNALKNFEYSCEQAATKDDGKIDKEEEKTLKKIHSATQRFLNELEKLN